MVSVNQAERFSHLCNTEQSIDHRGDRNHAAERAFLSADNQTNPTPLYACVAPFGCKGG